MIDYKLGNNYQKLKHKCVYKSFFNIRRIFPLFDITIMNEVGV